METSAPQPAPPIQPNPAPPIQPNRVLHGISAAYLPWRPVGQMDLDSFAEVLERTWACGLIPAINMDTGFANLLSPEQRDTILKFAGRQASSRPFVAGAFVEGLPGDCVPHYRKQMQSIADAGGLPIVFQSSDLVSRSPVDLLAVYRSLGESVEAFLGFELGTMFAPFGAIYDLDFFEQWIQIPQLVGIKHSSLSRELEWQRLAIRDRVRPEFRIYTGNDLAIDMVQWGSDYLLGLSAFYPEAFALRDRYWCLGDRRFYELNDALQLLGGITFRNPVPGYKHNLAMALRMRGVITSDAQPPGAVSRPSGDRELIEPILSRIEQLLR